MRVYRALKEPVKTIEIPWRTCKWGYRININHPLITPLFHEWSVTNGLSTRWPISDTDRMRFECGVLELINAYGDNIEKYLEYHLEELKQNKKSISAKTDHKQNQELNFITVI